MDHHLGPQGHLRTVGDRVSPSGWKGRVRERLVVRQGDTLQNGKDDDVIADRIVADRKKKHTEIFSLYK
jgi:hypothetical protein